MSQNDSTPDQSGTGAGGSSSSGRRDLPEYGQRVDGAPSGPSYEPPRYGQGATGDQYSASQYGQDQYGQGQQGYQDQYGQGQSNQGQYGQGHYGGDQYGGDQYGQGQEGYRGQYGQDQYNQGQQGYQGQYDMGQYGRDPKPAGTGLGIAALILGIVALLTCWFVIGIIPGLVGLVLGIVALRQLGRTPGASKALPIIGIVLSVLGILGAILFMVLLGAVLGEIWPAVEACSQVTGDQAALQECIEQESGLGSQNL